MARPPGSGRRIATQSSPLTFRRFGHAINTDEVFGTHSPQRPELTTLPLQSRPNASAFWIMLLLSVRALEHGMIKQLKASAVEIVVDLGLFSLAPSEKALGDPGLSKAAQLRAIGTKHSLA